MKESCCVWEKNEPDNREQSESLTVNDLKDKLQERQLRETGNQNELIQHPIKNNKNDNNAADNTVFTSDHEDENSTGDNYDKTVAATRPARRTDVLNENADHSTFSTAIFLGAVIRLFLLIVASKCSWIHQFPVSLMPGCLFLQKTGRVDKRCWEMCWNQWKREA